MRFCIAFLLLGLLFSCTEKKTRFERLSSEATGIAFVNAITQHDTFNILHNEYMYNGGGVGIGDLNNDGLQDIVFTGNQVQSAVYMNLGNFKFRDITTQFKGLTNEQWYSGVVLADINADGLIDAYFTSTNSLDPANRKNKLWVNQGVDANGLPSFIEMAEEYGIADDGYSVHAGFFDYDLDGDLDLYVLNNIVNKNIPTNYRDKIKDGTSVNNDQLYKNLGNGKFERVTNEAGIIYEGYGLGIAFGDVNKDGYPDIYISNDYIANDILYMNQKDGTFKNVTKDYISYQSRFSMGNDLADMNNDGFHDLVTLDMMPEEYFRKKQTINGNSYYVYMNNAKYSYEQQHVRNMLQVHNGFLNGEMLPYSEVAQMAGVYQTEWSWSPLFADFDNDGDRDLFITNGFPKDLTDKDFTNYKAQVYGFVADDEHVIDRIPIVKVSNYAYENVGDNRFENRTENWGMSIPSFSNGAAFVDLDNDGDLDYVVNNIDDPAFVYRNNTIGKLNDNTNYIRLSLKGDDQNTQALGSRVELWHNGTYQYYEHYVTRGYISSIDPVVHFGIQAPAKQKDWAIDSIRIIWPKTDRQTVLRNVKPNQWLTVSISDSEAFRGSLLPPAPGHLVFERDRSMISFKHLEDDFIDFFQNQRIIPHKFSQIGPCMAKGDLNGDGLEDLLIGSSDKQPTTVFVQKNGTFAEAGFPGLTEKKSCSEADMLIADFTGDGKNDIIIVSGGYYNQNNSDYKHYLYVNQGDSFSKQELPVPPFIASVVRAFDFDQDGDLDLFIGSRVKMASFPIADPSYILVNDNGVFKEFASLDLGMVTDAVWSDYNGDGWADLVITRQWNSVALIKNAAGKSFGQEEHRDLASQHGLWYSIVAADLDNDGDMDYVLGNLGENHRFNVSEKYPMRVYRVDIDNNSFIDPITTAYWKDKKGVMQEYPVHFLDELASQSPFFRKRFTSYTAFSYSTIDSIMNTTIIPEKDKFKVNTTTSYILWNDKGSFTWERLPSVAQSAPIRRMHVQDLNGDGNLDVIMAGNDYSYDVSTGYFDANKGLVLAGKGNRKFEVLTPSQTGLLLKGQVTSLLYFTGDSPFLVAGINRDSILVHRHKIATPLP
jgi:enediyne biosynthesis protein E4